MPIEIRNDPSYEIVGAAAHAGGYGQYQQKERKRQEEFQLQLLQMAQQQYQQDQRLAFQGEQNYYDRENQAGARVFEAGVDQQRDATNFEQQRTLGQEQYGRLQEQDQVNFGQQKEFAQFQEQVQSEGEELRLTNAQKRKKAQILEAISEVRMDPKWSKGQADAFEYNGMQQIAGFKPLPMPKEQPSVQEQVEQSVGMWTDPSGKQIPVTVDRFGTPRIMAGWKQPLPPEEILAKQAAEETKLIGQQQKQQIDYENGRLDLINSLLNMKKSAKDADSLPEPLYTPETAEAYVTRLFPQRQPQPVAQRQQRTVTQQMQAPPPVPAQEEMPQQQPFDPADLPIEEQPQQAAAQLPVPPATKLYSPRHNRVITMEDIAFTAQKRGKTIEEVLADFGIENLDFAQQLAEE